MLHSSRRLLAGSALAGLAALAPTHAQTINGTRVIANTQAMPSGRVSTTINDAPVGSTADAADQAAVTLDGNALTAKARANVATASLTDDMPDAAALDTHLGITDSGIEAAANSLIVNSQTMRAGVDAAIANSDVAIHSSTTTDSAARVTDNAQSIAAVGNQFSSAIDASAGVTAQGVEIAGDQRATPPSAAGITATLASGMSIATGPADSSELTLSGNQATSYAAANTTDNALSLTGSAAGTAATAASGSAIEGSTLDTNAGVAIATRQTSSGIIAAHAGGADDSTGNPNPAFLVTIAGDANDGTIANSANSLTATAEANRTSNAIDLANPGAAGQSAAIGSQQTASQATVVAGTSGAAHTAITGTLASSRLTIADNDRAASGSANSAVNRLSVTGASLTTSAAAPAGAIATIGSDDVNRAAADYGILNDQAYGVSTVSVSQDGPLARATIGGDLSQSQATLAGNRTTATARGNQASNALNLDSAAIAATAALNSIQSGDGGIAVTIGSDAPPTGVTIASDGAIDQAALAISANAVSGSAIGNDAANRLAVDAATIAAPTLPASAGAIGGDYGATGALALASQQKLGQTATGNALVPDISSIVVSDHGISAASAIASSIAVKDNSQRSDAIGNSVSNDLGVTAAQGAAGSASLSSSQYGQARVDAGSTMTLILPTTLIDAPASLSGNSNIALGVINDADNRLNSSVGGATPTQTASASAANFQPPLASGSAALANQQFATGSASATASLVLAPASAERLLDGTMTSVAGNSELAESAGNRVLNALDAGGAGAALASTQTSLATIGANASLDYTTGASAMDRAAQTVEANTVSALARGNVAQNTLSTNGSGATAGRAVADTILSSLQADAALVNAQNNLGPVAATTRTGMTALNAPGAMLASSVIVNGNATSSTAIGNAASNSITATGNGAARSAGILNSQTNMAPIAATVTATGLSPASGSMRSSTASITANQIAATAIGNQASSAIAASR